MKKSIVLLASAVLLLTACQDSGSTGETTTTENTTMEDTPQGEVFDIAISGGDDMKFDLSEIKVKAGQTVRLTLTHTGAMAADIMGHNFVLLAAGTDLNAFAAEAMKAKETDYIPESMKDKVLAHTKTVGGGETDVVEFTAPEAGEYEFLCSFPGHAAMMKGKFIVE